MSFVIYLFYSGDLGIYKFEIILLNQFLFHRSIKYIDSSIANHNI